MNFVIDMNVSHHKKMLGLLKREREKERECLIYNRMKMKKRNKRSKRKCYMKEGNRKGKKKMAGCGAENEQKGKNWVEGRMKKEEKSSSLREEGKEGKGKGRKRRGNKRKTVKRRKGKKKK